MRLAKIYLKLLSLTSKSKLRCLVSRNQDVYKTIDSNKSSVVQAWLWPSFQQLRLFRIEAWAVNMAWGWLGLGLGLGHGLGNEVDSAVSILDY